MKPVLPIVILLALGGCATAGETPLAQVEPSGDPLIDAAALLAASERAPDAEAREPLLARLDALAVTAAPDASDDPLAGWRTASAAEGGTPWRGRALGPAYRHERVAPGASVVIEQVFLAGERAEIAAEVSATGAIALKISDPRAEPVCSKDVAPRAQCNWLPTFTERYAIEIANRGRSEASVYLVFR
jgi:hypothetical protein